MDRIKTVSHWFRILFQAVFIFDIAILVWFWMSGAQTPTTWGSIHATFLPLNINVSIPATMSPFTKLLGFLVSCIPTGITLGIYYCLIKLFSLYERAEIFTAVNVSYIKKIGYLLLASALVEPLYEALLTFVLSFNAGHGHRTISASFGTTNISDIVMALMIILVSWIMAEGCKLRDEQAHTI